MVIDLLCVLRETSVKTYTFLNFQLLLWVFCLHVCPCTTCMLCPEEGIRSLGTEVTDGCELPCGFRESNLVTQEEQTMFLATEISLWLPKYAFKYFVILL